MPPFNKVDSKAMGISHFGSTALLVSALGCWLAADAGPATPRNRILTPAPAAGGEIERLVDSLVVAEALSRGVPGVAVAVVADGKVILRRGYGVADIATGRRVTDTTPFNIASVTKPFTAAMVQLLVAEGRIRLDAPVSTYLPLPAGYGRITVRQLLTHTSGIARDLRRDNDDDPDVSEYRRRLDASVPSAEPGIRFEYSNTGFTVLGWMIEAVEGRPLEEVFRRRLFGPLGMRQARYRAGLAEDPARARPHEVVAGVPGPATAITGGFGSGGLSLSAADFAAFGVALQAGRFLAPAQLDTAWTAGRLADGSPARARLNTDADGYGFGWFITSLAGRRLATHGGGITGFSANLYHFPDERITIAVVANVKGRDDRVAPVDPLARRIAGILLGSRPTPP